MRLEDGPDEALEQVGACYVLRFPIAIVLTIPIPYSQAEAIEKRVEVRVENSGHAADRDLHRLLTSTAV